MKIERRLAILEHLYAIYDRVCGSPGDFACAKFCAHCCSRNVTMTTLEGFYLLNGLAPGEWGACRAALAASARKPRFVPRWTTNQMAAACRDGGDPPVDAVIHDGSRCALLEDAACSFYVRRPFGCRCLASRQPCGACGYADVDDWNLTVNTVFLQMIEHVDRPGCFGNLQDILLALASPERRAAYAAGNPPLDGPGLIANHAAPMLLVPPEHRGRMAPILTEMQQGIVSSDTGHS